jgi:uncharacterized protein YcfJ
MPANEAHEARQKWAVRRATRRAETAPNFPEEEEVSELPRDQDKDDGTPSGALVGGVSGAALGAVVGGPVGAVIGAAVGAAGGKVAEEANKDSGDVPTGNPTDADSRRTKRTYSGQIYEEGSLEDVPRKDTI